VAPGFLKTVNGSPYLLIFFGTLFSHKPSRRRKINRIIRFCDEPIHGIFLIYSKNSRHLAPGSTDFSQKKCRTAGICRAIQVKPTKKLSSHHPIHITQAVGSVATAYPEKKQKSRQLIGENRMTTKWVYSFNEGDGKNKKLLGGKGANLCEMTQIGLRVPPGFVITTEACLAYLDNPERVLPGLLWMIS